MSFPYVIRHDNLELHITVFDIDELHLHEEIVPDLLEELVSAIGSDGYVKHPVIADLHSHVVLDGMHRIAALKELRYSRVPVCFVDYENPVITVGCWYRAIKGGTKLLARVKGPVFVLEKAQNVEQKKIGVSPLVAVIKTRDKALSIKGSFADLKEAYDIIKQVEEGLRGSSFEVLYETESDALCMLFDGVVDAVLLTPKLTKETIVRTALSREVFCYKATRHIVPARPLHVDVPLRLLRSGRSLNEVNDELGHMLRKRRLRLVTAGNVFGGRRYEEDAYVFEG